MSKRVFAILKKKKRCKTKTGPRYHKLFHTYLRSTFMQINLIAHAKKESADQQDVLAVYVHSPGPENYLEIFSKFFSVTNE